jgi:aspartyl protease family protein
MSNPSGIGRGMTFVAWIIVLGLMTLFFSRVLERQHNPNQRVASQTGSDAGSVVLQRNRQGHYIATALINGQPTEVMLDTGATRVSIPEQLADALGLQRGRAGQSSTANGMITTYATTLDSVQLGDITLHNVRASINPNGEDVLLGMSFLKQLEFTQRGDTLILRDYRR